MNKRLEDYHREELLDLLRLSSNYFLFLLFYSDITERKYYYYIITLSYAYITSGFAAMRLMYTLYVSVLISRTIGVVLTDSV